MDKWDKNASLREVNKSGLPEEAKIIKKMNIVHWDLELQGKIYAETKTEHGKLLAKVIIQCRMDGSAKSDAAALSFANLDPEVNAAHLAYRLAEQMVAADKEQLKILHAELEAWRTRKADERAADTFQARTGT